MPSLCKRAISRVAAAQPAGALPYAVGALVRITGAKSAAEPCACVLICVCQAGSALSGCSGLTDMQQLHASRCGQ